MQSGRAERVGGGSWAAAPGWLPGGGFDSHKYSNMVYGEGIGPDEAGVTGRIEGE